MSPYSKNALPKVVKQLVDAHILQFSPEDCGLVYIPYIDFGKKLAEEIGCGFYNAEDSLENQETTYFSWRERTGSPIIVSTKAFSTGNDYAHIPLIIHAGDPREMMQYIQEISRGGRNGMPTCCYLFPSNPWKFDSLTLIDCLLGVPQMLDMCNKDLGCLRYMITFYNDGHGIYCKDHPDNLHCSFCQPDVGLLSSLTLTLPKLISFK